MNRFWSSDWPPILLMAGILGVWITILLCFG